MRSGGFIVLAASLFMLIRQPAHADEASPPGKPNIIWIWADNLAYGDLGAYGNRRINTPVIDGLARSGVRLSQYYVAHTVCSPSRAALLTGRQPFRTGIVDVLRPDSPTGVSPDEITLAEALREQGYATAAIGKWHLGDRRAFLPLQHGFDTFLGLPYSMDMLPTLLYEDDRVIEELPGDKVRDVTERFVDKAIDFVASRKNEPFFLYFSHTIPHPPLSLPPKHRTAGRPIYYDAIEYMDMQTGRVLAALERHGLTDNTLVFFSSDNGPMLADGDTAGLRGGIRDAYEGGIRVPLIARWPGRIPAGRVSDTPAIAYDIFPTLVRLAGGKVPKDRVYDGQDILPILTGQGRFERHQPFIWVYLDKVTTIRDGRWKLHVAQREKALKTPELYDVIADAREGHQLNDRHPEIVEALQEAIANFQAQVPHVWSLQYPVRDPAKRQGGIRRE